MALSSYLSFTSDRRWLIIHSAQPSDATGGAGLVGEVSLIQELEKCLTSTSAIQASEDDNTYYVK